jgi:polar amino acid transport system substrate-binding protein
MPIRCCLYILLCLSPLFVASANGCELRVRTFSFPPLGIQEQGGTWKGMDMDFTKALLDKAGCRYSFVDMPWARAMRMLKVGDIDLMLNVSKTVEREKSIHFVGPQRDEVIRFVSRKGLFGQISHWQQFETLEATLMRQRGTFIGERLSQAFNTNPRLKSRVVTLADNDVRIELLEKGRADGFFAESSYLYHQMKHNPAFAIVEVHPLVIHRAAVYYAFSKASISKLVMNKINRAYEQIVQTKQLHDIAKRYHVEQKNQVLKE